MYGKVLNMPLYFKIKIISSFYENHLHRYQYSISITIGSFWRDIFKWLARFKRCLGSSAGAVFLLELVVLFLS